MRYPIWYNQKNVKNAHEGELLLVELQTKAWNVTKSNTPPWVFFSRFSNCAKHVIYINPAYQEKVTH